MQLFGNTRGRHMTRMQEFARRRRALSTTRSDHRDRVSKRCVIGVRQRPLARKRIETMRCGEWLRRAVGAYGGLADADEAAGWRAVAGLPERLEFRVPFGAEQ